MIIGKRQEHPARLLARDFPELFAILKDGRWRMGDGTLEIDDSLWGQLTAPQKAQAEQWAAHCGIPSRHLRRMIVNATTIDDLKQVLLAMVQG